MGYSPFLQFTVQDMDSTLPRLLSMGGMLDGPIKYPVEGKVHKLPWPAAPCVKCAYPRVAAPPASSCQLLYTPLLHFRRSSQRHDES